MKVLSDLDSLVQAVFTLQALLLPQVFVALHPPLVGSNARTGTDSRTPPVRALPYPQPVKATSYRSAQNNMLLLCC